MQARRCAPSPFSNEKFITLNQKFDFLNIFKDIFGCTGKDQISLKYKFMKAWAGVDSNSPIRQF